MTLVREDCCWLIQFLSFMVLFLSLDQVIASDVDSSQNPNAVSQEADNTKSIRDEFFSRLNDLSFSKEKERVLKNYEGMTRAVKQSESARNEVQGQLNSLDKEAADGKSDMFSQYHQRALRGLLEQTDRKTAFHETLKRYCLEQYAILVQLEDLESARKSKSLEKTEYLQQRRYLMEELGRTKYNRLLANLADDLIIALQYIEAELREVAYWTSLRR